MEGSCFNEFGIEGPPVIDPPPAATAGQTLVWRANFASTSTINSGSPSNFTSVSGTGYSRKVGPRFGPANDPSWQPPGWSLRIPPTAYATPTGDAVFAGFQAIGTAKTKGMVCGWFKLGDRGHSSSNTMLRVVRDGDFATYMSVRTQQVGNTLTLGLYNAFTDLTDSVSAGVLNQWVYLCTAWSFAAGTFTWRGYYSLDGVTVTLIGEQTAAPPPFTNVLAWVTLNSLANEIAAVGGWNGAVGGVSLYSIATLDDAATYPADLSPPPAAGQVWCVNPVTGSDSNSGYGAANAWQTASKLVTELDYGTVLGSYKPWVNGSGVTKGLSTVTTDATNEAWRLAYRAGDRLATGDVIEVRGGPLLSSKRINLESHPGVTLRKGTGGSLTIMQDMGSVFTQPNSGSAPLVWQKLGSTYGGINYPGAGTDAGGVGYEGTRLMTPKQAANLAAVLSTLNSTPGSCYADASGFYFSTFGGTNPNSDGFTRRTPYCLLDHSAVGNPVVALGDNLLLNLDVEAGPIYQYVNDAVVPQYVVNTALTYLSVIDGGTLSQGSFHNTGMTGTVSTGANFQFDVTHERMWTQGGATTTVTYTSSAANCRLFTCFDGVIETSVQSNGAEATPYTSHDFFTCHNNGDAGPCFSTRMLDLDVCGSINEALHQTGEFTLLTSRLTYVYANSAGSTATRCEFLLPGQTAGAGDLTVTNSLCHYDAHFTAAARQIAGSVRYDRCTIDFTGFTGSMLADNGTFSLTLTSCAVIANGSTASLVSGASNADTISIGHTAFLGSATPTVLASYNDGATTANRTYAQAVVLGLIATSVASASSGLNSGDDYAVSLGSPVIGVAASGTNVEDYTGVVFNPRNDAGAREYVA